MVVLNKIRCNLLILVQLFFVITISAQNSSKYTSSNLNLRIEPNTSSQVLVVIPKGTEVNLAENCDCDWIQVQFNGNIGYVYSKYLTDYKTVNNNTAYSETTNRSIKYYTNSDGERVQSPTHYDSPPPGATALCRDGTYSFSRNRRGTCSHHGGVAKWLK